MVLSSVSDIRLLRGGLGFMARAPHYHVLLYARGDSFLDLESIQSSMGVSRTTLKKYLAFLVKEGLVERRNGGFYLTDRGFKLARTLKLLKEGVKAPPYVLTNPETGVPIALAFSGYQQLYAILKYCLVDKSIVEYHLKNYMEGWLRAIGDEYLVELVKNERVKTAEDLKNYLEKLLGVVGLLD